MKAQDIERDMDALEKRRYTSPLQEWFDARPELATAVIARTVDGDFPAMTMYFYLAEKHGATFGESTFRHWVRKLRGKRKASAA